MGIILIAIVIIALLDFILLKKEKRSKWLDVMHEKTEVWMRVLFIIGLLVLFVFFFFLQFFSVL